MGQIWEDQDDVAKNGKRGSQRGTSMHVAKSVDYEWSTHHLGGSSRSYNTLQDCSVAVLRKWPHLEN